MFVFHSFYIFTYQSNLNRLFYSSMENRNSKLRIWYNFILCYCKKKKYDVNWLSLCQRLSAVFSSWDKIGWKLTLDFCKLLRLGWRHKPKNVPYYLLQCTGLNMCILCVLYFCKPSRPTKTVAFFSALFLHVSFMMIYWR